MSTLGVGSRPWPPSPPLGSPPQPSPPPPPVPRRPRAAGRPRAQPWACWDCSPAAILLAICSRDRTRGGRGRQCGSALNQWRRVNTLQSTVSCARLTSLRKSSFHALSSSGIMAIPIAPALSKCWQGSTLVCYSLPPIDHQPTSSPTHPCKVIMSPTCTNRQRPT